MTCARREAGARKPTHSAGSSRPDPRPGHRRARLSLLLPALALLFGALGLFGAAPAEAQITAPSVPQNVAVTPGEGKLTLTWRAPHSWGTWPASHYAVEFKPSSAPDAAWGTPFDGSTVSATATAFELSGQQILGAEVHTIAIGTAYDMRIRAVSQKPNSVTGENLLDSAWVTVTGKAPAIADQTLTGLALSAGGEAVTLSPAFSGSTRTDYTATVPNTATTVTVTATWTATVYVEVSSFDVSRQTVLDNLVDNRLSASGGSATVDLAASGVTNVLVEVERSDVVENPPTTYYVITVSKAPAAAPAAPAGLGVRSRSEALELTWRAPPGTVSGYDVHYTSAAETGLPDGSTSVGTNAATHWVAVSRTGTVARQTVPGLTNGTDYRVRVRATNAAGNGAWAHGTGTPAVPVTMEFILSAEPVKEGSEVTTYVQLSAALPVATTVGVRVGPPCAFVEHTATEFDDFTLSAKTLSFPAGTTRQGFTVSAVADRTTEGEETACLNLVAPDGAPYEVDRDGNPELEVVIEDFSRTPGLYLGDRATVREDAGAGVIVIRLGNPAPAGGVTVTLSVGAGSTATETADFALSSKTVTIAEGELFAEVTLTVVDDSLDDDGETIVLEASSASPAHTAPALTVTIVDNDPPVLTTVRPSGVAVAPGPGTLVVTWDAQTTGQGTPPDYRATVQWQKAATATPGTWFYFATHNPTSPYTIPASSLEVGTAYRVRVGFRPCGKLDPVAEPEAFPLCGDRSSVAHWVVAAGTGTPELAPPGPPRNVRLIPGDDKFTVLWEEPASWGGGEPDGYEVLVYTTNAVASANARVSGWPTVADAPYPNTSWVVVPKLVHNQRVNLAENGHEHRVRVAAVSRKPGAERDEFGDFSLGDILYGSPSAEVRGTPQAGLPDGPTTIALSVNDDDNRVGEDVGALTVTATLNAPVTEATTVTLSVGAASTATEGAGADFTLAPKSVTVARGEKRATATLAIRDDTTPETNEVVVIEAASGSLTGATLNVAIVDDDQAVAAPTGIVVTPGDGTLAVSWTAPAGTVTGYDVWYKAQAAADRAATTAGDPSTGWVVVDRGTEATPPAASQTLSSLTNGTAYDVVVRAKGSGGATSQWLSGSGTPSALTALATPADFALAAGDGEMTATWSAVANADSYVLSYSVKGSGTTQDVDAGGALTVTVSNLVNGTEYRATVQARDSSGAYGPSAQAPWRDATPAPALPSDTSLSALTASGAAGAGGTYAAVALERASGGSWSATVPYATTHAKVTPTANDPLAAVGVRKGAAGAFASVAGGSASAAIALDEGANAITVRVTAQDATVRDHTVTVTRQAEETPGAPGGLTVTPGNAKLYLSWTAPAGAVTGYDVHYTSAPDTGSGAVADGDAASGADPAVAWVAVARGAEADPPAAAQTLSSLANATTYRVRVRAVNGALAGVWVHGAGAPRAGSRSSDAALSALTASASTSVGGTYGALGLTPATFSASTRRYTATVGHAVTHVKLTPTASHAAAAVGVRKGTTGAFTPVPSGGASAAIALDEGANAITVRVTAENGATRDYTVTVTRPPAVTLSALPNPVTEGESVTVTATLSSAAPRSMTVPVTVTRGSAEAEDLGTLTGVRIARGRTSGTGRIATRQDEDTDDETFTVALDTANLPSAVEAGATVSVTVTIDDDDTPTVELYASPRGAVTAGGSVTVTAKLSEALPGAVTIPLTLIPDRGTTSADYGTLAGITIAAGARSGAGTISTRADGDTLHESFRVALGTLPPEVQRGTRRSWVRVTIAPASVPIVWLTAPDAVDEGGTATVTARLTEAFVPAAAVRIPVTARFGNGPAAAHEIPIAAGATSGTLGIAVPRDDDADHGTLFVEVDTRLLPAVEPQVRVDDPWSSDRPVRVTIAVMDIPAIETKRSTAREGRDEWVEFTVRLSYPPYRAVRVSYTTAEGAGAWQGAEPATAGADYTHVAGTVAFGRGETAKRVWVPILDDAVDEGTEYFLLRFSDPRGAYLKAGETQGLITNDDHLQAMWLARFGRAMGRHITGAVGDRLAEDFSPGAHATVAGQRLDLTKADDAGALADVMAGLARRFAEPGGPASNDAPFAPHGTGRAWNDPTTAGARSMTGRELLLGSAFQLATDGGGSAADLAAWGRVAHGRFDGEHVDESGATSVDGEVLTGTLGADADFGRVLAGVAVSLSEGDGQFASPGVDTGDSGAIESTMTTVSPYLRFKLTERVSAWGLAGWGTGDMTLRFDDGAMAPIRTDIGMRIGAIGARGALLEQDETGGMDLALKADAFFVRMDSEKAANSAETTADASQVRLVLEGGRAFAVSDTATLRPALELGLRHDGGDAETGAGLELGGGIAWADTATGFSLEAKARVLAAHADSDYEEWGMSATARLDPGEQGRGLSFSLTPTLGTPSGTAERLWGAERPSELAPGSGFEATRGLRAEAGYGLPLFEGRFTGTPNVGLGLADGGARDWRLGWRLSPAVPGDPGFEVNLDAVRREPAGGDEAPEHGVMLRGALRW